MDKRFEKRFTKEHVGMANELTKRHRITSQSNAKGHREEMHYIPIPKSRRRTVPDAGEDV